MSLKLCPADFVYVIFVFVYVKRSRGHYNSCMFIAQM